MSILGFRFESAFQMLLIEMPVSIYNHEEFKKRKISGNDYGHEWVFIPKFCGKWVVIGLKKVNQ